MRILAVTTTLRLLKNPSFFEESRVSSKRLQLKFEFLPVTFLLLRRERCFFEVTFIYLHSQIELWMYLWSCLRSFLTQFLILRFWLEVTSKLTYYFEESWLKVWILTSDLLLLRSWLPSSKLPRLCAELWLLICIYFEVFFLLRSYLACVLNLGYWYEFSSK